MKLTFRKRHSLAALLSAVVLIGAFGTLNVTAQRHSRHYYRSHNHSRTKGALIGGAAGAVVGALVGGRKGALIGAGAGAGSGYLIQRHRNDRHHRRYYSRNYRRH